ncbi:hypothetical protein B9Z19DRAFT_1078917 [Tuber borchii]|uniref:Uncharacterized protein n=1 Tax=Tuber borchii TaxID=42251 RepID=A0A2T6ZYR0_TUBBO|nr:hypothetical protein B9Z19DRAFT_1078917 [Tuber borchii]
MPRIPAMSGPDKPTVFPRGAWRLPHTTSVGLVLAWDRVPVATHTRHAQASDSLWRLLRSCGRKVDNYFYCGPLH